VIARWRGTARANPPAPQLAKPAAARGSNEPLSWSLPT
jgi:hypothetical protein